jgi:two-component sensor histidine kinase/Tfp pilus assembly protein PilF
MKLPVCLFLLLFSIVGYAQQTKIDSLTVLFNETKADTTKARLLSEIGIILYSTNIELGKTMNDSLLSFTKSMNNKYYAQGLRMQGTYSLIERDFQNAEKSYSEALKLSKALKDSKLQATLFGSFGTLYGWQGQSDLAIDYYKKAIKINDSLSFIKNNIRPYINIAITLSQQNKLETANEYLLNALKIAEDYNVSNQLVYLYNEIANNYLRLDTYDKAENYLNQALPLADKQEDNLAMARIYNSLGYLYETRDEDWLKTLEYYEESLAYHKLARNEMGIMDGFSNAGIQYMRLGNYNKAKNYFNEALLLASKHKVSDKTIIGNLNLSELAIKQKNAKKSLMFLDKAHKMIGSESKMPYKNHFYRIGNLFAENKIYKTAYENVNSYAILADSLHKENNVRKISEIETKYQTEKKEKENLQLKTEKTLQELATANANKQKWILAIGLICTLITLIIFSFYYRKNKKQKTIIEGLQKELHHRIKNNLSVIDTFLEVAKEEFKDAKFLNKLTEIQNRIYSINELHTQLHQSNDITNVIIKPYVQALTKNVKQSFTSPNVSIQTKINDALILNPNKSFPLGLMINEFLTNSFKYAFDENGGNISITVTEHKSDVELQLCDTGKGLPKDFDVNTTESFGLRFVKLLSQQLDGTFELKGDDGVQLLIRFPK